MIGSLPPDQMAEVMRAMVLLALGTAAARPLALRLVPGGGGWIAAIVLAWAVMGWVPWFLSALGLVAFGQGALSGLLVLVALRVWTGSAPADLRGGVGVALAWAGLFWLGLAQRMGQPDLRGLEKFTNMGLLGAAMRADWMPPQDAWFAGATVNYYYVGQAMAAAWGYLAASPPDHAYQIAMASLFALTGLAVFRLTQALAQPYGTRIAAVLGGTASLLTLYGGNLHSALYTLARPLMGATNAAFYFPDSTRFIGFDPPVADKGFTEFPAYAFAVGDLHAHVIATPLFLLGVLVLHGILRRGLAGAGVAVAPALALGWVLGLCLTINSWDFAVLGLMALIVALLLLVQRTPRLALRLDDVGLVAVLALGMAFLVAAPFLGSFVPFASGIEPAPAQTPLWQLLVIYGHGLPAIGLLAVLMVRGKGGVGLIPVLWLALAALFLIALPETVIVRDIYGMEYARANTMFKFSFRAQTLLLVVALAALAPAVALGGRWLIAGLAAAVPVVAVLAYLPFILVAPSAIRSLDGLGFLGAERDLVEAARYLPLAQGEALIEAAGDSFGETGRVSAMTGQAAVIGWAGHEWLWRGDSDAVYARVRAVDAFYTDADAAMRCDILRRYRVRYVILGEVERRRYPALDPGPIRALGWPVHAGPGGEIVQIDMGLCPK